MTSELCDGIVNEVHQSGAFSRPQISKMLASSRSEPESLGRQSSAFRHADRIGTRPLCTRVRRRQSDTQTTCSSSTLVVHRRMSYSIMSWTRPLPGPRNQRVPSGFR